MQRTKKTLQLKTQTIANLSTQRLATVKGGLCADSAAGEEVSDQCPTAWSVCCVPYSAAYCAKG